MVERGVRAIVRGRVQGVGFRDFVLRRARSLVLRGSARNRADGTVEVVAVGDPAAVDQLVAWLRLGPGAARVDGVEVTELAPLPVCQSFEITR